MRNGSRSESLAQKGDKPPKFPGVKGVHNAQYLEHCPVSGGSNVSYKLHITNIPIIYLLFYRLFYKDNLPLSFCEDVFKIEMDLQNRLGAFSILFSL